MIRSSKGLSYCRKAEKAINKLDHNVNTLISTIPDTILHAKVSVIMEQYNGDMNIALFEAHRKREAE